MSKIFHRYENNLGGMNALINKTTGEFIGQSGLLVQTVDNMVELEVAYSILPKHRGKGYAPEAAKKCIDFSFENSLKESLISIIHKDNVESQRVAFKNGLTLEKQTMYDNNPVLIFRIKSQP
jgi:[ribosomal protein S5]-alanine N-acetyltransferase